MAYRIDYFRSGVKIMASPCPVSLEQVKIVARDGLYRFQADKAHVLDMDRKGVTVAIVNATTERSDWTI